MRHLLAFVLAATLASCFSTGETTDSGTTTETHSIDSATIYHVNKLTTSDFDYLNTATNSWWNQAEVTRDFRYPWRQEAPPETTFRALYDDTYFYFLYEVVDTDLHVFTETGSEVDVENSDRIEIFFLSDGAMNPYYCLEMDTQGNVYDYEARFYRNMNIDWAWPEGELDVHALPYENGYAVAGRISLASLRALNAIQDNQLTAALLRGNVVEHTGEEPVFKWVSWAHPEAAEPDFHIPSAFGTLVLQP